MMGEVHGELKAKVLGFLDPVEYPACHKVLLIYHDGKPYYVWRSAGSGEVLVSDEFDPAWKYQIDHSRDEHCELDDNDACRICGVFHADPCPLCNKRGFHEKDCPRFTGQSPLLELGAYTVFPGDVAGVSTVYREMDTNILMFWHPPFPSRLYSFKCFVKNLPKPIAVTDESPRVLHRLRRTVLEAWTNHLNSGS